MDPEIWTAVVNMKPGCKILVVELPQDSLYDESGVMCYEYGDMGEVTYTNHEIQGIRMRPSSRKTVVSWGT